MYQRSHTPSLMHQSWFRHLLLPFLLFLVLAPLPAIAGKPAAEDMQLRDVLRKADFYAENNKLDSAGYWYRHAATLSRKLENKKEVVNSLLSVVISGC